MIGSITVRLGAIRRNALALRELIAPAKAAFVVKSNAYGHGLTAVAKVIQPLAFRICVYSIDEALELRDAGITARIFVMGPIESADLDDALAHNIEVALWDTGSYLRALAGTASRRHTRFAVHVKINTGAARFGLEASDAPDALEDYARISEIDVIGVFSHLAAAEELDSPFTNIQLEKYERAMQAAKTIFEQKGIQPIRHIAASAAAMLWPQTRLDMARCGIALYGLWPSPETRVAMNGASLALEPALSYTTTLAAVRSIEAGTPIGYGCSYHAPKATRIGIVPVGYADGVPRLLSNHGAFIVAGARCPIVGRVCMNVTIIDLAAAPNAKPGDAVTLIGKDGNAAVTADDWALWAQTINYEVVTRLPESVPRIFEGDPETDE
jgi:alanine racemase